MTEQLFEIKTPGIDAVHLMAEIQQAVDKKLADGVYDDARIARAERLNLNNLRNEEQFLGFYLRCLRDAVYVNISDFEIHERRKGLAPLLVAFKKTIWNLLKFYTYRLWSQQNEVNGLLVTAIESMDEKYTARIEALEKRLAALEELAASGRPA
jgi:hypothetical protein